MAGALGMMSKGGFFKKALPVLASVFLPGAGAAVGAALGATGTTAAILGNAIIGGGVGALTQGRKGVLPGAVLGGGAAAVRPMFAGAPDAASQGALTASSAPAAAGATSGGPSMSMLAALALAGAGGGSQQQQPVYGPPERPESFTRPDPVINFDRENVAPESAAPYYSYGTVPFQFFANNSISEAPPVERARGGRAAPRAARRPMTPAPQEPMYVKGPGSGRDDIVPAMLSNDEFVMDAETVALAGDGSPEEGARKLDELRDRLRKHKGKALAKGKFSPDAKPLDQYFKKGRK